MSSYPEAEQVPWAHNIGDGPTYFYGGNQPIAVVLHIQQGYKSTARQWALSGHMGASWHYTVGRDGSVMQHLRHEDGGYHAGIPETAPAPTWALWRGHGQNVNTYTIGIEHEGFSGDGFTDAQRAASRSLCRWLAQELGFAYDREHFPAHAEIDLVNRPNDFAPAAEREAFYQYLFEEDDGMTDNDILAVFGSTEADPVERLANAKYRYQQSIDTGHSPFDLAAQAQAETRDHIKNHAAGVSGPVADHVHMEGKVKR